MAGGKSNGKGSGRLGLNEKVPPGLFSLSVSFFFVYLHGPRFFYDFPPSLPKKRAKQRRKKTAFHLRGEIGKLFFYQD